MTGLNVFEVVIKSNRQKQRICRDLGAYALVLAAGKKRNVEIGKLGVLVVEPGHYVYLGSAAGPGGVGARVERHLRRTKRFHWHIDYLTQVTPVDRVWYSIVTDVAEHRWAGAVAAMKGASIPLVGFGSSDCRCVSHLFRFSSRPTVEEFARRLG